MNPVHAMNAVKRIVSSIIHSSTMQSQHANTANNKQQEFSFFSSTQKAEITSRSRDSINTTANTNLQTLTRNDPMKYTPLIPKPHFTRTKRLEIGNRLGHGISIQPKLDPA
jgi:hypothetical protein